MLTTKNDRLENLRHVIKGGFPDCYAYFHCFLLFALAVVLAGCKPPGPKALWDGKDFLDRGQYTEAIAKLKTAASLLNTNAQAWNYLGLAYHQAGQANEAADAYKKALALDENLVEAHYNLGCLWLEQNRPDLAKGDLTAYTMQRGDKSPDGWIKLGAAQLRLHDLAGAEKSLNQARQLDAQNPEALNDIGIIELQQHRVSEAAQYFSGALKTKSDYAPAILNLAIVSELYLNNHQYALQRYHDYLALKPRPANWDAVDAAVRALEQEVRPVQVAAVPRPPAFTNRASQVNASSANTSRPPSSPPPRAAAPKPEPPVVNNPRPPAQPPTTPPVEVVQLEPEPVVHTASDSGSTVSSEASRQSEVGAPNDIAASPKASDNRSFLSRMNPANLFRSNPKTNQPEVTEIATANPEPQPEPVNYPRYSYRYPRKPASGNHAAAEKDFAQGSQAQQAGQLSEAVQAYRRAIQADPGFFDPYYNLGVVSFRSGNLPQALEAYETALSIEPASHDARFNFALALMKANYPIDAANELEKLLAKSPNDAYAHYALGSLYDKQLGQPAKARQHYQKVLELDPSLPQAAAIHDWLWAHPR